MSNGEKGYISVDNLIYIEVLKKFFSNNNFKTSNPKKDLMNFLDQYGLDIDLLVDNDISSETKNNQYKIPKICEEILVAMKKTYDEKQSIYTKDTKNITADDLKKHNKLLYDEIEHFPDNIKKNIKNSYAYKFNKNLDKYINILMIKMQVLFTMIFSESNLDLGNQMKVIINLLDQLILSYAKSLSDKEKITKDMKERGQEEIISINKNSISKINENYLIKKTGYLIDNELKKEFIKNIKINNEIKKILQDKDQDFRKDFKKNMIDSNDILEWYNKESRKNIKCDVIENSDYKKNIDLYLSFSHNVSNILMDEFNLQIKNIANLCIEVYNYVKNCTPIYEYDLICLYGENDFINYIKDFNSLYGNYYNKKVYEVYKKLYNVLFNKYGLISTDLKINLYGFYEYIIKNVIKESSKEFFYYIFKHNEKKIVYGIKNDEFENVIENIDFEVNLKSGLLELQIEKGIKEYLYEGKDKYIIDASNKELEEVYNKIKSLYNNMEEENKKLRDLIEEREELQNKLDKLDKKTKSYKEVKDKIEKKNDIIRKNRDMRTSISHFIGQSLVYAIEEDKEYMSSQIVNKENLYKNI